jgi:mono/diheme cytochrome c family protein
LVVASLANAAGGSDGTIAAKAQVVLKTYCYRCHGQNGRAEAGFNTAIDLAKLVSEDYIKPKEPGESALYKRMTSNMPPKMDKADRSANPTPPLRPSAEEIAIVKAWIEAGASPLAVATKPRTFISDEEAIAYILADLEKIDFRSRRFIRYFTLTHLYNAGLNDDQLATYRVGLSKLINSLSWGSRLKKPTAIDPAKTILRIDLTDYKWNEATWREVLAHYPYGVTHDSKTAKQLYVRTACDLPYVRADWFVFAASKPPLYHNILGMPKTERSLYPGARREGF